MNKRRPKQYQPLYAVALGFFTAFIIWVWRQ
jgi:hypothetical protein